MSYDDEKLKLHIQYRGLLSMEGKKVCYNGGSSAPDMEVDPDLLSFSVFEDFTKNREVLCDVEKVWYRLANEDMSVMRSIWKDKDNKILKMASEAKDCGEVYLYIEHSVSPQNVVDGASLVTEADLEVVEQVDKGEEADDEDASDLSLERLEEALNTSSVLLFCYSTY